MIKSQGSVGSALPTMTCTFLAGLHKQLNAIVSAVFTSAIGTLEWCRETPGTSSGTHTCWICNTCRNAMLCPRVAMRALIVAAG